MDRRRMAAIHSSHTLMEEKLFWLEWPLLNGYVSTKNGFVKKGAWPPFVFMRGGYCIKFYFKSQEVFYILFRGKLFLIF